MSGKKPTAEELAQRIDQLLIVLKEISEDLTDISKNLKTEGPVTPTTAPIPSIPSPAGAQMRTVADIRSTFPKELENMLFFEDAGSHIIIKPRAYLGSENFAKIASLVRGEGGEYISAGKESHFRVPKEPR
jgi:hypothetical protein